MRVQKFSTGCIAIYLAGEENRVGIFIEPKAGPLIELYDGLAEELLAALRTLLEKKP